MDMNEAIKPKSDQLNADSLLSGPVTIKITDVKIKPGEQPISVSYVGDNEKPYKPCKSMARVMVQLWGNDSKKYVGRSMTLYCDPDVTWAGMKVGGIRISHMSNIDGVKTMPLTSSKGNKKPFTVKPLTVATPAETPKPDQEAIELKALGDTNATLGVSGYTAWKDSLTPEQKAKIKPYHSDWSKIATAADTPAPELPDNEEEVPV